MLSITLLILWFGLVTIIHAGTLCYIKKRQQSPLLQRNRWWSLHFWINGALWWSVFIAIFILEFYLSPGTIPRSPSLGVVLASIGGYLIIAAHWQLGLSQAMGRWFFFPEEHNTWVQTGVYRFLCHPIYDGFILLVLGIGLWSGTMENFTLGIAIFILLNLFLSSIENPGRSWYQVI